MNLGKNSAASVTSNNFPTGNSRSRKELLIWIVPALAVLIAIGLAVQAVLMRGPEITIQFPTAEGLEVNKTKIKYKDVEIGMATSIALSDDQRSVKVTVAMAKQAESLLVKDSRFWIVRPRIGAGGISGLSTMLSGAFISIDPGSSHEPYHNFIGLDTPPLIVSGMSGRQFLLTADDLGSLDIGAPVYYRRIPVGRVVGYAMHPDGKAVSVRIFVDAPFDRFVTTASRFWHASGIDVSLDSEGVKMDIQSLVSLAVGGVAFTNSSDAKDVAMEEALAESEFPLFNDRTDALKVPDTLVQKFVLIFDESVRGLTVGSPVDFRGLPAGEVSRIDLDVRSAGADVTMAVEISLYPDRLASRQRDQSAQTQSSSSLRQIIDSMVVNGLRAQLRTANLLTGQRYVALDFFPKAKATQMNWAQTIPQLPTQAGSLDSLQDQLQSVVEAMHKTLEHTDKLVVNIDKNVIPELSATLIDARSTLNQAERVLASDSPTQLQLRDTLREVGRAATAVRDLADLLERHPQALITGRK
ncbi:MlaD family protein [Shewanella profunda]|jgi:paraquat-inducible protein B|uniref:PqiB family protein n=1 Tax=Shewanella profunda TaxID=254793 RepID=UPI00200F94AD|nr:MlaD family protein [Shewanella profunda]MCL1089109.1 MlaD family protein [Shewanella profunda]